MKSPVNTSKLDPAVILFGAMINPGRHIEDMEAAGQQELVNSNVLPTEMNTEVKETLESFGIKFLEQVPDDEIFTYVILPDGWLVKPTEHNMWTTLIDDTGKEIADIFYKAAFYDRHSEFYLREENS